MATEIYGTSDDLIEVEGEASGEVSCYGTDDNGGVLLFCSDGTILEVRYGKFDLGMWGIKPIRFGELFNHIDECTAADEDAERYSDTAHFRDGLKWVYAATEWEKVI